MLDNTRSGAYIITMKHGGKTMKQAAKVFSGHPGYRARMRALEAKGFREASKGAKLMDALRVSLELEAAFATPVDLAPVSEVDACKGVA
jgi:hypothetical protein